MTFKSITLPKTLVAVLLASFYSLAFILSPYWRRIESTPEILLILTLIGLVGAAWVSLSAHKLEIKVNPRLWKFLLLLFAISLVLNLKPLLSVIPWRGDEDYHVQNTLVLASQVSTKWLLVLVAILCLLITLAWRKSKWTLPTGLLCLAGTIAFIWLQSPLAAVKDTILFRYPYVNYWFFALLPKLALIIRADPYQEILFRVVPFLASLALVWICQTYFLPPEKPLDLIWGCAVATLPLLYYYSSILYLELPAVVLMMLVCIHIPSLLQEGFPTIKQNAAWYALILIGFIKETTIVFLLCFVGWRWIAFLAKRRNLSALLQEGKIALASLLPAVMYLFVRNLQARNRGFSPHLSNLAKTHVLRALGLSLTNQMGLFLILFLAGCLILLRKREYLAFGFLASVFLFYPIFFALDAAGYAGYSRFNLFVLPPVLAAAGLSIKELTNKMRTLSLILAGIILCVNLWTSPIHWDGTKKPFWGNYMADTSEHYYPYRDALAWLKTEHGRDRILFTGMRYPYISFAFYFSKLHWQPDHEIVLTPKPKAEASAVSQILAEADSAGFDVVLYQVTGSAVPKILDSRNFMEEKVFRNEAHLLVVYSRSQFSIK